MMKRGFILSVTLAALILPNAVYAQETGLASMHTWRKVGKKTCMVDHYHNGTGRGASRQAAEAGAIKDWSGFTAFEYGSPWADYRIAVAKEMNCTRTGDNDFSCSLSAMACRPY
jgi:hypothetical protein